ncbi:DUF2029 domain-containing protein [Larkinella rosea]|uniref:Glycosyltransferase RgtA/B/C/D-like domain-containing protein n=1 Tax=Larkinella rosea TaxID=2025312 RepID=A0A3P1BFD6_9BACT|nr:DUF2029 domain-containing protein [Larkinella rosea]RRA99750.1 hypothetical protein EHT25_24260 [Larkinella rosea]
MKNQFFKNSTWCKWVSILILFLPVAFYGSVFIQSLVNFPFYDDFFWYNKLILQAHNQPFLTQLQLIIKQHSDHRLILLKGSALLMAALGPFDFRWPILLTNGIFFLFSAHLVVTLYRVTRFWLFAAPCVFILYQFLPYTAVFSYGLQTLGILLFLYFAFFYVWKTDQLAYILTGLAALACVLTNTNGLLVLPILAVLYSLTHRFRAAFVYGLFTVLAFGTYFLGNYQWNAGTINDAHTQNRIFQSFLFLVEMLGAVSNTSLVYGHAVAVGLGLLVLSFISWAIVNQMQQVDWRHWYISPVAKPADARRHLILTAICMLGFILFTCLLLTYKRFNGIATQNNIAPHYRQYSSFALCFCYVVGLLLISRPRVSWIYLIVCTSVAIMINVFSYLYIHQELRFYTLSLRADAYNYKASRSILFFPPIDGDQARKTVTNEMVLSYTKHLIALPPAPVKSRIIPGVLAANVNEIPDGLTIALTDSTQKIPYLRDAFIILRNSKNDFYFPFINKINTPRTILRKQAVVGQAGYAHISRYIPNFVLPAGRYQAFLFDEGQQTIQQLSSRIEIPYRQSTTNY